MPDLVNLYIGQRNELNYPEKFEKAIFLEAEPTRSPANIPKYYNVEVKVRSDPDKGSGKEYKIEIDSRTINNWYNRFEEMIDSEIERDPERYDQYTETKERNAMIIEILSNKVPMYVNKNS